LFGRSGTEYTERGWNQSTTPLVPRLRCRWWLLDCSVASQATLQLPRHRLPENTLAGCLMNFSGYEVNYELARSQASRSRGPASNGRDRPWLD